MAPLYLLIGLAGMALALIGTMVPIYPLAAIGAAMICAAVFMFSRTNQGTPAPAHPDVIPRGCRACRRLPPGRRAGVRRLHRSLAPRSVYALTGAARWFWQHSIRSTPGLRYS